MNIPLIHKIEERSLEEIKAYYKPKVFIEFCKACEHYNKIWTCPPYDFDTTEVFKSYQYVYVIGSKLYINNLDESFKDLLNNNNLEYVSNEIFKSARTVLDEKIMGLEDSKKHLTVLLPGRCLICDSCSKEKQLPCIYPKKMRFSLESIGFDVASICEDILGDKMQWTKEGLPEYFILVSAVLSKEKLVIEDIYNEIDCKKSI